MNNNYLTPDHKWYYFQSFERFNEYYKMKKQQKKYYMPCPKQVAAQYVREWETVWIGYNLRREARLRDIPTWKGICGYIENKCKKSIIDICKEKLAIK